MDFVLISVAILAITLFFNIVLDEVYYMQLRSEGKIIECKKGKIFKTYEVKE